MGRSDVLDGARGFWEIAQRFPDRVAVIDADGGAVTFGALLSRVNPLSNALRASGLRDGDTVAVVLANVPEFFEVSLAADQIGLCLVPINWHLTSHEMAYILTDSDARVLVASERYAEAARAAARGEERAVVREVAAEVAPDGAVVEVTRADDTVTVEVTAAVPVPGPVSASLPAPSAEGRAVALEEPP